MSKIGPLSFTARLPPLVLAGIGFSMTHAKRALKAAIAKRIRHKKIVQRLSI
jgi:hypothetical protein